MGRSKKGSKTNLDGNTSLQSDVEGASDKVSAKSKSGTAGGQNAPPNGLYDTLSEGSQIQPGEPLHGNSMPVSRDRVSAPSAPSASAITHGQTMSQSSSAANLTSSFSVPLMDSYLDSESDSDGEETSSGDDDRSKASTMTGTGSTMSVLPKHNRKVLRALTTHPYLSIFP